MEKYGMKTWIYMDLHKKNQQKYKKELPFGDFTDLDRLNVL